ncbi:MAG TPA: DUF4136 domain-containing protein [Lysobacter sp.]|nr:DUF4136 domain-containing protein [Lysobacter sp.]
MIRRSLVRLWLLVLAAVLLVGCTTGPRVRTDFDPEADFARYRTWNFYQPLAMEQAGYTSYLTEQIRSSIRREMDARGYVYSEQSPDLRINFQGVIRERTDVYSVPRMDLHYFYSYRHRAYFGMPFWYDHTEVNRYTEGTLTVDLVDAQRNRMVWTGAAIGRVVQRAPQQRAAEADRAIAAIFAKYPYRAGSGAPAAR